MNLTVIILSSVIAFAVGLFLNILWSLVFSETTRADILRQISYLFRTRSLKTKSIKKDIEAYFSHEISISNEKAFGSEILMDDRVNVEWVSLSEEQGIQLEEGEVIIRLGYEMDQYRNYVEAVLYFMDKCLIPSVKPYIKEELHSALKIQYIGQVVRDRGDKAFHYFNSHYLSEWLQSDRILDILEKTKAIRNKGFFRAILLRELNELGHRLAAEQIYRSREIEDEINNFIDFLYNIAEKDSYREEHEDDPPLLYNGRHLKVEILLVKSGYKTSLTGHVDMVSKCISSGIRGIYIAGSGLNQANAIAVYKSGLQQHRNNANVIGKDCIDLEIQYGDNVKKEGKICLIVNQI